MQQQKCCDRQMLPTDKCGFPVQGLYMKTLTCFLGSAAAKEIKSHTISSDVPTNKPKVIHTAVIELGFK